MCLYIYMYKILVISDFGIVGMSIRVKYRCEKEGCPAKKLIVMTKTRTDGGNFKVKYSGQHQH